MNENTLKVLEWEKILKDLADFSTSETGKRRCLETPLHTEPDVIRYEQKLTSEAKYVLDMALDPSYEGVKNTYDAVESARRSQTLNNSELISIGKNLETARKVKTFFTKKPDDTPLINLITQGLNENKELEKKILDIFDENEEMIDSASPELKGLKMSLKDQTENLKNNLNSFMVANESYLQSSVYTIRNDRYVVAVRVENKAHVPGIVHDVSASGATLFIEPKPFVEVNNKIKETELKIEAEIKRILTELSWHVKENADNLDLNLDILTEIDFIFAKGKYSNSLRCVEPEINSNKFISLKSVRHPILMKVVEKVVPNNVEIGKDFQILLVTGPNTGGKTVILKTVGVSILMAKAGLHIPAAEANIYPFTKLFADIGDEQSITQSLSTFSGHMKNIIEILNNTDDETLILLDEVGAGTDPMEGTALAEALMNNMKSKGAYALVTTHFSELKALAYTEEGFYNASVEFDTENFKPTYKLIMGIPGKSNAIYIAKNLGLDEKIAEEARHNYLNKKDPTGQVLESLQDTQQKLSKDAKTIEKKKLSIEELEKIYNEELEKIRSDKKRVIHVYRKKFDTAYFQAREEIDSILEQVRKEKSEKQLKGSYSKLGQAISGARTLEHDELEGLKPKYKPIDWSSIEIGVPVFVSSLGEDGILCSFPDNKGYVQVEVGIIKSKVKIDKVFKPKNKKAHKRLNMPKKGFTLKKREADNTLDLRGQSVDDALIQVDQFLDNAVMANLTPVYIVHGHGTGKLRNEIRKHIKNSPYIEDFRSGKEAEGGDGVTVVYLR